MAATYSANNGGTIGTTSSIPDDYPSLEAAGIDFNTGPALAANYTFLVNTSLLTETGTAYFGKATNGFTVTLRPAPGVVATVVSTRATDNTGPSGNIIIGSNNPADGTNWGLVKTDNFVVDGSNSVGGTTRDLTLTNNQLGFASNTVIGFFGSSYNCGIKNANVINAATTTSSNISAVRFVSRTGGATTNAVPHGSFVTNSLIQATIPSNGHAVNFAISGTITAGIAPTGIQITDNTLNARIRGIFFNPGNGFTVKRNSINIGAGGSTQALEIHGLFVNTGNSATNCVNDVSANTIIVNSSNTGSTGTTGASGLTLASIGGLTNTTLAYNNQVTLAFTNAAGILNTNFARGIRCTSASNYFVYNNSINITGVSTFAQTSANVHGIDTVAAGGVQYVRNNNVRVDLNGGSALYFPAIPGTLVSNNNNLVSITGGSIANFATTTYTTLANWQAATGAAAGQDANSVSVSQTVAGSAPFTGTWTAPATGDLHYNGDPGTSLVGAPISLGVAVTTDIDGQTRNTAQPIIGADEILTSVAIGNTGVVNPFAATVSTGGSDTQNITVTNTGLRVARVTGATFTSGTDFNATSNTFPINAANGDGAKNVAITFAPSAPVGAESDTVTLTINGVATSGISLSGTSTPPATVADWNLQ